MEKDDLFLNWDDAMAILCDEQDPVVQALLEKANAIVLQARVQGRRVPSAPFDQLFFVMTLRELFVAKDRLREILDGQINHWFDDG
jgi:hypothetical protein